MMSIELSNHSATALPPTIGNRDVMAIAWPVVVSMLSFSAMNFVDALWLAPLGTYHLAASGLGGIVLWAVQAFGHGLLGGLRILVAQRTGGGHIETVHRLGWQGLHLALWLGLFQMCLAPLGGPILHAMGASPETHGLADSYFVVRMLGAVPVLAMAALTQYLQGRGLTRPPMMAMLVANAVNCLLDPLLIHGFGPVPALGMAGAAWAANIAFLIGALYLLRVAWPELRPAPRHMDRPLIKGIFTLGVPMGGRFCLEVSSYLVLVALLNQTGDVHVAAHVLVVRTIALSFLPGHAMSEAVSVLVGQAVGADRRELIAQIRAAGNRLAVGFMCACGLVFLALPSTLAELLGAAPAVVEVGGKLFIIAAFFQIFDALFMVGVGVLNGLGDTRFVFLISVGVAWGLKVPLAWLLAVHEGHGAPGAWLAVLGEIVVMWGLVTYRLRQRRAERPALAMS